MGCQCGAYCFSAMKPVLGYVKANQHRWDSIESREVQWNMSFKATLEKTLRNLIPRDLEERLAKIKGQLAGILDYYRIKVLLHR